MIPLESVTLDTFQPLIGKSFTVSTPGVRVDLTLDEVKKLGHKREDALRDPFSLLFRGPQGLRLAQGIFVFACDGWGEIEFFITQVGDGAKGSEFEAIFT